MDRRNFIVGSFGSDSTRQHAIPVSETLRHGAKRRIAKLPRPKALTLPDVTLWTQTNRPVRLYPDLLKGKVFMINMFYMNCQDGYCPLAEATLARVQHLLGPRLGRDVFIYSISLDSGRRMPARLKQYAQEFHAHPGWLFLRGEPADIRRLRYSLGFWDPDPRQDARPENHTGVAVFANEPLNKWTACPVLSNPHEIVRVLNYVYWPKGPL